MFRRSFLGTIVVGALGLVGIKIPQAKAEQLDLGKDLEHFIPSILFDKWIGELVEDLGLSNWSGSYEPQAATIAKDGVSIEYACKMKAEILTEKHSYWIVANFRSDNHNYLGCTMSNCFPLPGETWTRGSDLADGSFSEETWQRIVRDIKRVERTGNKYGEG